MMPKPVLISCSFRKRAGKDEVANHLVSKHGFKRLGWADLLKAGVNAWHGWGDRHGYGELKEVVDPYWSYSPREAYQKIGTDLMRDRWREDFWVRCAMRKVDSWMEEGYSVVIPDSRFENEARAVLDTGGQLWRIDRPSLPPPNPPPEGVELTQEELDKYDHWSEIGLLKFEGWSNVIVNDGTLEDLYAKVDGLVAAL